MPRSKYKNADQLQQYLDALCDPKNEQKGISTFWSRTVRDNGRALVDALMMERERIPPSLIRILTMSADRPKGYDMVEVHDALREGEADA